MQDELGPPALAFVRTVCAVLALDSALEDQVAVLRRNLLKLVHVREYASASEFQVGHTLGIHEGEETWGGVGGGVLHTAWLSYVWCTSWHPPQSL